jgi:hypothetical protein
MRSLRCEIGLMSRSDVSRGHPALNVMHVHKQCHLPFLPDVSATRDRRGLRMKTSNTAGV